MEITKREILFSTIILTLMISLGILIHRPILNKLTEDALRIASSTQVSSDTLKFDYIRRTEVGDFLAEGEYRALDPVSLRELRNGKKYLEIKKVKERYTRHTETYTTTDSKGHTHTHTRTYHSWDVVDSEKWEAKSIVFLSQRFSKNEIKFRYHLQTDTTIYEKTPGFFGSSVGDIRHVYYTWPETTNGVMIGEAKEKWYRELEFKKDKTIEKMIDSAEKDIHRDPIIFWVLWLLLTGGLIFGFYYLENVWLED